MEVSFIVYISLALFTLFGLVLVLLLHLLPSAMTGIPTIKRINTVLFMLVINAAVRCAIPAVDVTASRGSSPSACSIDSIWTMYTTSVVCATLVPLALYHQAGCVGRRWSSFECVARTAPVYVYGMVPVLLALIRSDHLNKLDSGLGLWWGTYCVPDLPEWHIVRLVTLLVPLGVTAVIAVINCGLGKKGRAHFHLTTPSNSVLVNLLGLSLLGIIYVVVEASIEWNASWWPRAFEPLFCLLILSQGEFLPYARGLACGMCMRQPHGNEPWQIESPASEPKVDDDDQAWAIWIDNHHPNRRHLSPIPEDSESCASSIRQPSVPVIAVQMSTPHSGSTISFDPLNREGACAPSPDSHRYSDPFADEEHLQLLAPVMTEAEDHLPMPVHSRGFKPRLQYYNYDSETESDVSVSVQPPDRLSQQTTTMGSNPSLSGDADHPPLSPMSDVSSGTFGRRTLGGSGSSRLGPSTLRSDSPLSMPRVPFGSEPSRFAPDSNRLSVMTWSSIADSFVTAGAGSPTYASSNPSDYFTPDQDPPMSASPSVSVTPVNKRSSCCTTSDASLSAAEGTELPSSPERCWSIPCTPSM
ncbi:hypothetical protein CspHIS471_0409030 [Cutaneotrichosporon sp. HIS471]|nr:hypothetical protein CspHIS471_0409030 [Cutaneotrichosporon sp. HIS471]